MLVKNYRLNISIGVVYKEVLTFLKTVTKILIFILDMFCDFVCKEGQDLFLFGYQWFWRSQCFSVAHFYPWEPEEKSTDFETMSGAF